MKTKKSIINIFFNLISQIVTLGLGIIIPKLFLINFGSEINGAVNSIGQIFSCVSLLEAGIGGVTTQALYKTVVNNDYEKSNRQSFIKRLFQSRLAQDPSHIQFCQLL